MDDSAFMRKVISNILSSSPDIEVIGKAINGMDAIEKITKLKPDVVTLDIEMPVLDGLNALGYIMSECPTPVIIVSAADYEQAHATITAFQYGAVDFIQKPSGPISLDLESIKDELIKKVKSAAKVRIEKLGFIEEKIVKKEETEQPKRTTLNKVVVIGTSTGGPRALQQVIPFLPKNLSAAVLVIQHMPLGFTKSLAERLDSQSKLRVKEAEEGDIVRPGVVLIAPGDFHMTIKQKKINAKFENVISLNKNEKVHGVRPSVDVLLESVVPLYGHDALGVILTGMGSDGTEGIRHLKSSGGTVIVEDESTCVVYGMPRSIIENNLADSILPINKISECIVQLT